MTKEQMIDTLKSQLPGFYSAEQVIEMINQIEEPDALNGFSQDKLDDFIEDIVGEIKSGGLDMVDDYNLEMSYREVELVSVEFNENYISKVVKSRFKNHFTS
jgi:hypothetical protein